MYLSKKRHDHRNRRHDHRHMLVATIALLSCLACYASAVNINTNNRPNIIIMQPDDLAFFDEWTPPPNTPNEPARQSTVNPLPAAGLPNLERLRRNGLQMTNAYAAAPMCADDPSVVRS